MKRILSVLIVACLVSALFGCAKCVDTEYQDVEVKIVDVYRRSVLRAGGAIHPPKYRVTVRYSEREYVIRGKEAYNKYKDKVGQTTTGTLEIRTYDNGDIRQRITQLK